MDDLIFRLQRLGDGEHDDLDVAHEALAEIVRLRIELAEANLDAARYRWLRDEARNAWYGDEALSALDGNLTRAVDSAMLRAREANNG